MTFSASIYLLLLFDFVLFEVFIVNFLDEDDAVVIWLFMFISSGEDFCLILNLLKPREDKEEDDNDDDEEEDLLDLLCEWLRLERSDTSELSSGSPVDILPSASSFK